MRVYINFFSGTGRRIIGKRFDLQQKPIPDSESCYRNHRYEEDDTMKSYLKAADLKLDKLILMNENLKLQMRSLHNEVQKILDRNN
ncbi:unnamed protein product [Schistosoma turkestanicum]|nr:unnamed protein product [Schistosoma turkestanicum]